MSKLNPTKHDRLHDKRKALGLCVSCGQEPAARRHVLCDGCMKVRRVRSANVLAEQVALGLCTRCGGPRDGAGNICLVCLARDSSGNAEKIAQRIAADASLCRQCGLRPGMTDGGYCKVCKPRWSKFKRRLKLDVILGYGGKCSCCSEAEVSFLTMDHINRDGKAHRASVNGGTGVYRDLKERGYPDGYRVLCYNCHLAITYYGICPHEIDRDLGLICDDPS